MLVELLLSRPLRQREELRLLETKTSVASFSQNFGLGYIILCVYRSMFIQLGSMDVCCLFSTLTRVRNIVFYSNRVNHHPLLAVETHIKQYNTAWTAQQVNTPFFGDL